MFVGMHRRVMKTGGRLGFSSGGGEGEVGKKDL